MDQSYQTRIPLIFSFLFRLSLTEIGIRQTKIYSLIGLFCAFVIPHHEYYDIISESSLS